MSMTEKQLRELLQTTDAETKYFNEGRLGVGRMFSHAAKLRDSGVMTEEQLFAYMHGVMHAAIVGPILLSKVDQRIVQKQRDAIVGSAIAAGRKHRDEMEKATRGKS